MQRGLIVRRSFAVVLFTVGLLAAFALALVAGYFVAVRIPVTGVWVLASAVVCFVCAGLAALGSGRLWRAHRPTRFAMLVAAGWCIVFTGALGLSVLRPYNLPHTEPVPRASTQYWTLPSGSRIAYSVYEPPAGTPVRPEPIVFLHGGPGLKTLDADHAFYSQFARDGFRVYLYDQVGSGLSGRLPSAAGYTVERMVADLEQIRQRIRAERLILIGHSWGSALAAHYAAAYPARVAKLVFHSPGPIWFPAVAHVENERTAMGGGAPSLSPRAIAAFILSGGSIPAAEHLASQQELGDWEQTDMDPRQLVCAGQPATPAMPFDRSQLAGINMYPGMTITREMEQPRMNVIDRLRSMAIPSLLLEAECDFVPWSEHAQYLQAFPHTTQIYFPGAGHYINLSKATDLAVVIRAFLLDQPPPRKPVEGIADPRPPLTAAR